jgi:DNA-binding transcriptional MerR regulator
MEDLVKMATLAKRSGVPAPTIKHYMREGLLPGPARRTARNMAYYDAALVDRIATIKRLQREHFLPLGVIRELLDAAPETSSELAVAHAVDRALQRMRTPGEKTRQELIDAGVTAAELEMLEALGVVRAHGSGPSARFLGDDVAILRTLGAARKAGIDASMLPVPILGRYIEALRALVAVELELFKTGVLPRAGERTEELSAVATTLSERLVVLLRRKLIVPMLAEAAAEASRSRRKPSPQKRQRRR